jgi:ABC-type Na+ transport system ATPase subunit NatA
MRSASTTSLTVQEYLNFFGAAYRMNRADVATRAAELLVLVHLTEYTNSPCMCSRAGRNSDWR